MILKAVSYLKFFWLVKKDGRLFLCWFGVGAVVAFESDTHSIAAICRLIIGDLF